MTVGILYELILEENSIGPLEECGSSPDGSFRNWVDENEEKSPHSIWIVM